MISRAPRFKSTLGHARLGHRDFNLFWSDCNNQTTGW